MHANVDVDVNMNGNASHDDVAGAAGDDGGDDKRVACVY